MLTALVTVVSGKAYELYAKRMIASAKRYFHPTSEVAFYALEGKEGWPAATGFRYHVLLDKMPVARYVYMIDADMLFEDYVGPEILPLGDVGITATLHPGYVGKPIGEMPYENDPQSKAFVEPARRRSYFCGGFIGGERTGLRILAAEIAGIIDRDLADLNRWPTWHDESALNRALVDMEPRTILNPSYCYPDNDTYYKDYVWTESFSRKIVALDKSDNERESRGT